MVVEEENLKIYSWIRWKWHYYINSYCLIHNEDTRQGDIRCSWTECESCTLEKEKAYEERRELKIQKIKKEQECQNKR